MLSKRSFQIAVLVISVLFVASFAYGAAAQAGMAENPTIVANEEGVILPENLVAGITTLTIQNDTETAFAPTLVRLNDGVTMEEAMSAMQSNPQAVLALVSRARRT